MWIVSERIPIAVDIMPGWISRLNIRGAETTGARWLAHVSKTLPLKGYATVWQCFMFFLAKNWQLIDFVVPIEKENLGIWRPLIWRLPTQHHWPTLFFEVYNPVTVAGSELNTILEPADSNKTKRDHFFEKSSMQQKLKSRTHHSKMLMWSLSYQCRWS